MAASDTTMASGTPPVREPDEATTEARGSHDEPGVAKTLGISRWVQVAFMVAALLLFWLLDRLSEAVWGIWGDPDTNLTTALSAVVAGVVVWRAYRNDRVHRGAHEVVGELVKVSWPSRKETSSSTVVVIITSIIAAILLGVMDAMWSTITDFIY